MSKNKKLLMDQLRIQLGEIFIKEGLTSEVITISQELDKYIVEEQINQINYNYEY